MTRESAGAAIRALRESRGLSLADLAGSTGVSIMGLSYLERGARKPHKGTVQKVENGLGLPPGSYARLMTAADPTAELADLLGGSRSTRQDSPVVVGNPDGGVLEAHAEAHLEALNSLIARLPAETSNEYESYIRSVIAQCVKAEMLAADSWRVAVTTSADSAQRLMTHLKALEDIRVGLLERMPGTFSARFDRACAASGLPESVIAALIGVTGEDLWDIRNHGAIPVGVLQRVQAFLGAES